LSEPFRLHLENLAPPTGPLYLPEISQIEELNERGTDSNTLKLLTLETVHSRYPGHR
jgi:hypothetical protein